MRRFLLPILLAATACLAAPQAHAFCGFYAGKADATLFNEASQVVLVRDGPRTVLSMLNDYQGPLSEFALVVPTPTVLQQGQVRVAEKAVFERLDAYSAPRLAEYHDDDPCQVRLRWGEDARPHPPMSVAAPAVAPRSSARDAALGVTVEVQYTLEEYDIVSLSATQSDGLETWLHENGYRIPRGAYKTLRPLQFAFESEKFMLPMRLGMLNAPPGKAQELIVYVLTRQGRVEASNYRTIKLPANMNLPYFVKPKFADFYKAMFEREARKVDHRAVFTEYFWDMAWCDPCADRPLTTEELRKSGAFWVGGNEDANFRALLGRAAAPAAPAAARQDLPPGAQPVVLTRLHLRYTPESFPEDLMFTQTRDRQNWQARYVIQTPHAGSIAQCSAKVGAMECAAVCRARVQEVLQSLGRTGEWTPPLFRDKDPLVLQRDCVASCEASKRAGLAAAARYYEHDLPQRLAREKQVLAQLTGWSAGEIDALPQATTIRTGKPAQDTARGWWQRLWEQRP